jgi:hypothetical protein
MLVVPLVSAIAVELITNDARAAVTPDAAAGIKNLNIKSLRKS